MYVYVYNMYAPVTVYALIFAGLYFHEFHKVVDLCENVSSRQYFCIFQAAICEFKTQNTLPNSNSQNIYPVKMRSYTVHVLFLW